LKATQEWGNTWYTILDSIHESINQELELLYHENVYYRRTVANATTKKIVLLEDTGMNCHIHVALVL
jgi:hypothetical protein